MVLMICVWSGVYPSGQITSKTRRTDVDATSLRLIDIGPTGRDSIIGLFLLFLLSSFKILFTIISSDYLFYIDKVWCVYSLESPR